MILTSLRPYDLSVANARQPVVASTVLAVLATLMTLLRYVNRLVQKAPFGWDDFLMLGALLSSYAELILYWCCVTLGGTGRHAADVGYPDILLTLKLLVPFELLYNLSMTCLKCGIIAFYFRLFGRDEIVKRYGKVIIWATVIWGVASIIVIFLICRPFSYSWDTSQPGSCGNRNDMYIINGIGNMLLDIAILVLPLPTIWKLKLPTAQKIGLALIFSLGIFVAIISIIRIKELLAVDFEDITWSLPGGLEWTCLEESIALINANLPFLRSIFKHMTPKAFSAQWASNQQSRRTNTRKTDKSIGDDTEGTFSLVDKSVSSQYMELPDYGTGHSVHSQSGHS
ncbi:uncharacterized protein BHQ10_003843 [Talaromyces amestolkiae]|uniref:Rhodopsin domain-containing protein n=1 Tax=Talaromyces amestolkiae TaxID=1196081 RepID=A0A364KWF6_TALAM|nr:uncharacterized protein BHQ10_003843 [Talaromyces amestolkiae]RAO67831.1 hypothetical protein BHQ10_003843 [Talaromyces amestolkiae]